MLTPDFRGGRGASRPLRAAVLRNDVLSKAFPEAYAGGQARMYHVPGNGMSGMSSWL